MKRKDISKEENGKSITGNNNNNMMGEGERQCSQPIT